MGRKRAVQKKFCYSCSIKILHTLLRANFYLSRTCICTFTSIPLVTSPTLRRGEEGRQSKNYPPTRYNDLQTRVSCSQKWRVSFALPRHSFFSILARARPPPLFLLTRYLCRSGSILEQTIFIFTRGVFIEMLSRVCN